MDAHTEPCDVALTSAEAPRPSVGASLDRSIGLSCVDAIFALTTPHHTTPVTRRPFFIFLAPGFLASAEKVARGGNMVPAMIDTKLMTRETYTLYGIEGDFGNKDGKLTFTEKVPYTTICMT